MSKFPRTQIEDLSVSRLLVGTNWFLGFTHCSKAKDEFIKKHMTRQRLADVLAVFLAAGVDTLYGARPESPHLSDAIRDAEDRTGCRCITMGTPHLDLAPTQNAMDANAKTIDGFAEIGCSVCLPHQATTDALLDRRTQTIRDMDEIAAMIRARGMIPGLSTHMPESIVYADQCELDVGTYVQIYNAAGFLMQIEADWVHSIIQNAAKPVITIKPLAGGRLLPLVGLAFNWATIRAQDMVCIGTMTPDEAREVIDISLSILESRPSEIALQKTRSKSSLEYK